MALPKLGNDAIARSTVDSGSDYAYVDVQPGWAVTEDGRLDTWHVYAQGSLAQDEVIHLLVWRPTADPQTYQLVVREPVTITAGNGLKTIPASTAARSKTIKPGDVLGFHIPASAASVIAVDVIWSWPYEPAKLGGSDWAEGDLVTFNEGLATGIRSYSLYADVEPAMMHLP